MALGSEVPSTSHLPGGCVSGVCLPGKCYWADEPEEGYCWLSCFDERYRWVLRRQYAGMPLISLFDLMGVLRRHCQWVSEKTLKLQKTDLGVLHFSESNDKDALTFEQWVSEFYKPGGKFSRTVHNAYFGMPYGASYTQRVRVAAYLPWYDVGELAECLRGIRRNNFAIAEQRQQALERLGNLSTDAPFAAATQFPEDRDYVCEGHGDWARKFQQLKSALSYKPGDKDEKKKAGTSTTPDATFAADIGDPQQAFWNSTTAMIDQISRLDGVMSRAQFEHHYGLTWA